jgi:1,4-dihydroxy-2-naphthoate polyprenyltransferase
VSLVAWIRASRPASQGYIFLPLLLGQALAAPAQAAAPEAALSISWGAFALVHLFGLFDQLYIVYANDLADQETDRANRTATIFSGGSRVLVDGLLRPEQLRAAATLMATLCVASALALGGLYGRWLAPPLALAALLLLWLYSFPPARLSYRGGGELLQMLGVGAALPLFGFHAQGGDLAAFPFALLLALLPAHLACALATTLPDEPSDRGSHKRTAAALFGATPVKLAIVALDLAAVAAYAWIAGPGRSLWLALPAALGLAQLALLGSRPGSLGLSVAVGSAVMSTLTLVGLMTARAWLL